MLWSVTQSALSVMVFDLAELLNEQACARVVRDAAAVRQSAAKNIKNKRFMGGQVPFSSWVSNPDLGERGGRGSVSRLPDGPRRRYCRSLAGGRPRRRGCGVYLSPAPLSR